MKNSQGRIKKLKKEIRKGKFEGLIIDRSKSQQEIDIQIVQLGEVFQKTECSEEIPELERDGDQYSGDWAMCCRGMKSWVPPIPQMYEGMGMKKRNGPKEKKRIIKSVGF